MEIDEESSHKKTKTSQADKISSEVVSNELRKVILIPKKSVQMNQFSFESANNVESSSVFKSKAEFMTSYVEMQRHSLEESKNLLP